MAKLLIPVAKQARTAIVHGDTNYTYAQLLKAAESISINLQNVNEMSHTNFKHACSDKISAEEHLQERNKGVHSSRAAIFSKPTPEFVAALWGSWMSGGVAVPMATSYPPKELKYTVQDSGATTILGPAEQKSSLEAIANESSISFMEFPDIEKCESRKYMEKSWVPWSDKTCTQSGDAAMLVYTSGTTGQPKGVVHTYGSISQQAKTLAGLWEFTESDNVLHCLPLHHVHGLMNVLISPLSVGATVHMLPKFSPTSIWEKWRKSYPMDGSFSEDAITVFSGVPTMYLRLLQAYDAMDSANQKASAYAASQLRLMMCGSAALPEPIMDRWQKVTGQRLLERYGMTELGMVFSNPIRGERRAGTVGLPLPDQEVVIVPEGGEASQKLPEVAGELRVKSPGMFREYWGRPEATAHEFDENGFFKTGDSALRTSDGYYKILGRLSVDVIKCGGFKLSALEIESTLAEHPNVSECSVFGVPDAEYGEKVVAVVVFRKGEGSFPESVDGMVEVLLVWAKQKMAPYKVPSTFHVVDKIPRNAMGKVNKKELKIYYST